MLNLFSSFPLSWLGGMIGPLCFCTAGVLLIVYELIGMYREPREGQRRAWYERALLWFGGGGITIGLVMLADMKIALLPDLLSEALFALGFFVIALLSIICCVIMLILVLGGSKREALPRKVRVEGRSLSERAIVLENPMLTITRISLLGLAVLCFMVIWFAVGALFRLIPSQPLFNYLCVGLGLLTIWCINRAFVYLRHLKRIEYLRVELTEVRPEAVPFAWAFAPFERPALEVGNPFQQPVQPFTLTILLRHTWGAMAGWVVYGLGMGAIMMPYMTSLSILINWAIKVPFMLLMAGVMFFVRRGLLPKVEATPYGLTSVQGIQTKSIAWQDARLFACYRVPGFYFGSKMIVTYELSGPGQVVQWTRVVDVRPPFAVWQPVLPMEEYQRQMEALCELITARTGLQLYDLSEAERDGQPQGIVRARARESM
jgi:hypothetical protein